MLSLVMLACEDYLRDAHWLELFSCHCRTRVPFRISLGFGMLWGEGEPCNSGMSAAARTKSVTEVLVQKKHAWDTRAFGMWWCSMLQVSVNITGKRDAYKQAQKIKQQGFPPRSCLNLRFARFQCMACFWKVGSIGRWNDWCKLLHP